MISVDALLRRLAVIVAVTVSFVSTEAAHAGGYEYVFQGTASGIDAFGYFGAPGTDLTGTTFREIFYVDPTVGYLRTDATSQIVGGGSVYQGSGTPSDGTAAPVTGEISINGSPYVFVGSTGYYGGASVESDNYGSYWYPSYANYVAAAATDRNGDVTVDLRAEISEGSPEEGATRLDQPFTASGSGQGHFEVTNAYTGDTEYIDLQEQIASAPEPGTWVLMLGGVGMLGAFLRIQQARRREDQVKGIATA